MAWEGIGTALVAAVVSLAVSVAFRLWESHKVKWLVTGEAHDALSGGRPTGDVRATALFHNVGDGDAYGVVSIRSNGDQYEPFATFERGKVAAGESVEVEMLIDPSCWEQAWVELLWESSPTGRSRTNRTGRRRLADVLWRSTGMPTREGVLQLRTQMRELPQPRRRGRRPRRR